MPALEGQQEVAAQGREDAREAGQQARSMTMRRGYATTI